MLHRCTMWWNDAKLNQILKALGGVQATLDRMEKQMSALDDAIATLTAEDAALLTAVQAAVGEINSIAGQISAAVAAALAAGATPAQLGSLTTLNTDLQARVNDLNAAVAAAPKP